MAHLDLGRNLFTKIKSELFLVSKVERDAKMEGKRMTLVLQPDHKDPSKLKPVEPAKPPMRAGRGLNIPPGVARPAPVGAPGSAPPAARPAPVAAAPAAPRPVPVPASVTT